MVGFVVLCFDSGKQLISEIMGQNFVYSTLHDSNDGTLLCEWGNEYWVWLDVDFLSCGVNAEKIEGSIEAVRDAIQKGI